MWCKQKKGEWGFYVQQKIDTEDFTCIGQIWFGTDLQRSN